MIRLTEELSQILPPALDTYFFSNSGAEAVEGAVKLARASTGKTNIIVFQGSFHGRTHATMAMTTSKTIYRAGFQPLVPGIFVAPFPYAYSYGWDEETAVQFAVSELKKLLKMQTAPEETAAMVIEPASSRVSTPVSVGRASSVAVRRYFRGEDRQVARQVSAYR